MMILNPKENIAMFIKSKFFNDSKYEKIKL
jgi:hypothetical protein